MGTSGLWLSMHSQAFSDALHIQHLTPQDHLGAGGARRHLEGRPAILSRTVWGRRRQEDKLDSTDSAGVSQKLTPLQETCQLSPNRQNQGVKNTGFTGGNKKTPRGITEGKRRYMVLCLPKCFLGNINNNVSNDEI